MYPTDISRQASGRSERWNPVRNKVNRARVLPNVDVEPVAATENLEEALARPVRQQAP